jgi:lambda family phage portal protein
MNTPQIVGMDGKPIKSSKLTADRNRLSFINGGLGNGAASLDNASLQGWNWWGGSPDDDITAHLDVVRQRCRDLSLNAPVVAGIINTMSTNVVGRGLIPEPTPDEEFLGMSDEDATRWKQSVQRYWEEFAETKDIDVRRRDNFYELQALVHRAVIESGDVFVTIPYVSYPGSRSLLDLRLQVIEADCVSNPAAMAQYDPEKDIFGGVEVGEYGEVIAYYIATQHPLAHRKARVGAKPAEWIRVPVIGEASGRRNILHIMRSTRPGQRRGTPFLAPVVEAVKVLDRYIKAELQAALVQSLFTAVIKTPVPEAAIGEWTNMMQDHLASGNVGGLESANQQFYQQHGLLEMGAGTVGFLAPGDDIEPVGVTRPASGFGPFVDSQLKFIGAALGLPFEMVVMMFTSSYSASRAAISMATADFKKQQDWLIYDFCQPVYDEFIANAVAKGYIKAPGFFKCPLKRRAYSQAKWSTPPILQLDPNKEADAYAKQIGLGIQTYSDIAAKHGTDYAQNVAVLHKEQKMWDDNPWDRQPLRAQRQDIIQLKKQNRAYKEALKSGVNAAHDTLGGDGIAEGDTPDE